MANVGARPHLARSCVDGFAVTRGATRLTLDTSADGLTRFDRSVGSTSALASLTANADGQTDIPITGLGLTLDAPPLARGRFFDFLILPIGDHDVF